jgi:hypothetical protein
MHSIRYRQLPHYFFEFDIYDKRENQFLDLKSRLALLEGRGIQTVPIVHRGPIAADELPSLIGPSNYASAFDNPETGTTDDRMEGLYLRTEANGVVTGRAKLVRAEFVEKIKQSEHWQHRAMVPNELTATADLWS